MLFLLLLLTAIIGAQDTTPPSAVTNLTALSAEPADGIKLNWTAPGDDGNTGAIVGGKYRIDYATYSKIWDVSDYKIELSTDTAPGNDESYVVTGLTGGATYYFRLWTADEVPNWSEVSNGATYYLSIVIGVEIGPDGLPSGWDFGEMETSSVRITTSSIVIKNIGNVKEDYYLKVSTGTSPPANTIWDTDVTPGKNKFTLQVIFSSFAPVASDFGSSAGDDICMLYEIKASSSDFSANIEDSEKGEDVPIRGLRNLWFRFQTPLSTSTTLQQRIILRIRAEESP